MKAVVAQKSTSDESTVSALTERSNGICELCGADTPLSPIEVHASISLSHDTTLLACATCAEQVAGEVELDENHWRCLHETIWSEVEAAQVVSWRILQALKASPWAADLLDQLYLDDDLSAWAEALEDDASDDIAIKDSNGNILAAGDSVSIIKDLDVKGVTFVAKRGTVVKNIGLTDDPEHISGRVNGVQLMLKTCFIKKI